VVGGYVGGGGYGDPRVGCDRGGGYAPGTEVGSGGAPAVNCSDSFCWFGAGGL